MGYAESKKMECGGSAIPCMDRLREELSCAVCLEICFEPSTTRCGHGFSKKFLRSAADKCGKICPKCRQLISNGRSCTVNTVLWNTIQLLFPHAVEARKSSGAVDSRESKSQSSETRNRARGIHALNGLRGEVRNSERRRNHNLGNQSVRPSTGRGGGDVRSSVRRREELPVQDEDAALASREEFMEAFRPSDEQQQPTSASLNYHVGHGIKSH